MIIEDQDGNSINTDKFDDIKAMVYEEIALLHAKFKPFGLSYLLAIKYGPQNVVGSIVLKKGEDFGDLIEFVDDRLKDTTNGDFGIKVIAINKSKHSEDEYVDSEDEDQDDEGFNEEYEQD